MDPFRYVAVKREYNFRPRFKVGLDFERFDLWYDDIPAVERGQPLPANKPKWKEIVSRKSFVIKIHLNSGSGSAVLWSNDLSEEYVNYNKSE